MINNFITKLENKLKEKNIELYQIRYFDNKNSVVEVKDGKVAKTKIEENCQLSIEVKVGKSIGGVTTQNFSDDNIDNIINIAINNAQLIDIEDENFFYDGKGEYKEVKPYKPMIEELAKLDKVEFLKNIEKAIYAKDERVNNVPRVCYEESSSYLIRKNSLGLNVERKENSAEMSVMVSAKNDNETKVGCEFYYFNSLEDFDVEDIAFRAVDKVVSQFGGVDVESDKYSVVFENKTFADLLYYLSPIFFADKIQEGKSKLKDKLGNKIATNKLTIVDNPLLDDGFRTVAFDGEGYPTKEKVVVENGVLKTYLHSLKTAHKDNVTPTGNGYKGGGVCIYNFYVKGGDISKDEILDQVNEGIYITELIGIGQSLNLVSGDVSCAGKGFLIKNGKINKPLNQFVASFNIYNLLFDIQEIGNDLEFKSYGVGSPTVWVNNITLSN